VTTYAPGKGKWRQKQLRGIGFNIPDRQLIEFQTPSIFLWEIEGVFIWTN